MIKFIFSSSSFLVCCKRVLSKGGTMNKLLMTLILGFMTKTLLAGLIDLELSSHHGTGCPSGTISTTTTDSGQTISVLFDQFLVELPNNSSINDNDDIYGSALGTPTHSRLVNNKNCLLNFMAVVAPGYQVDHIELSIDSRGAIFLEPGILGRFMSQLDSYSGLAQYESRSGRAYLVGRKMWRPQSIETDESWTLSSSVHVPVASRCATSGDQEVHFQIKNHMILMNRTHNDNLSAFIALDSQDMDSRLKLSVHLTSCSTSTRGSVILPSRTRSERSTRSNRTSRSGRATRRIPRY